MMPALRMSTYGASRKSRRSTIISRYGDRHSCTVYAISREGRWSDLHERDTRIKKPID
jgi:hypothetical protein